MIRILYVDFICNNWGQKRMNCELITYLSTFAKVDVLSQKNWYSVLPNNVKNVELSVENYTTGRFASRINSLKIMLKAKKMDYHANYDYIFAASYETFAFGLGRLLFKKPERFFIIHNNNLDSIRRKSLAMVFSSYAYKVNHLVLEQFIGLYLIDQYGIKQDQITCLPHPMNKNDAKGVKKIYDCVGISNSNEEAIIEQIIKIEKEKKFFKLTEKKVVLRSKSQQFDNGYLTVINGYLDENEYNDYINGAKAILVLFPRTFQNRMSGTIIDALSNETRVYGTDIPVMRVFEEKYPALCKVFKEPEELVEIICTYQEKENLNEFQEFAKAHSPEAITRVLKSVFI